MLIEKKWKMRVVSIIETKLYEESQATTSSQGRMWVLSLLVFLLLYPSSATS